MIPRLKKTNLSGLQVSSLEKGAVAAEIAKICALCHENFKTEYSNDAEAWVSVGAVEQGSGMGEGKTFVHMTCQPGRMNARRNSRWKVWKDRRRAEEIICQLRREKLPTILITEHTFDQDTLKK